MDSNPQQSRRSVLRAAGVTLGAVGLAGCLGDSRGRIGRAVGRLTSGGGDSATQPGEITERPDGPQPVLADEQLYLGHSASSMTNAALSGGPGVDGIPSIDDPDFKHASTAELRDKEPIFGVIRGGEAKAYPQSILVWHEIVNDTVGGEPVAVTYCPLTGTAQGFKRGETTFGVSGQLVNSNLLMYDRGTGTRWPQILATGIEGPLEGRSLAAFPVTWTTWGNWRNAHPNTQVLTTNTGYQRRYGSDPYGEYAPTGGYYANERTIFEPLESSDEEHPKEVVLGVRTAEKAIAFNKARLLDEEILHSEAAGTDIVAVADPALETGYVYRTESGTTVESAGNSAYTVNGETAGADELPLDSVLAFDAMFFAWYGFYPETTYVN